jgi:DNA-binding MarR family transcriptional regulator
MTQSATQRLLHQTRPFASPEQEVYLGLQVAAQRLAEPWAAHLKVHGDLTANQYNVLRILRGAAGREMTCREVADRTIARDPDVTRLIDRLDRRGLVERRRDDADRRVVRVRITARGTATLRALDPAAQVVPFAALRRLEPAQLETLRDLLNALLEPDAPPG